MTMRITPGKIYFGGGLIGACLFLWNRTSNKGLVQRVDGMREERQRQADELRAQSKVPR